MVKSEENKVRIIT